MLYIFDSLTPYLFPRFIDTSIFPTMTFNHMWEQYINYLDVHLNFNFNIFQIRKKALIDNYLPVSYSFKTADDSLSKQNRP